MIIAKKFAPEEVRRNTDAEDEIERILDREASKLAAEKDEIIAKQNQTLEAERQKTEFVLLFMASVS
jgi:hypothetical protein